MTGKEYLIDSINNKSEEEIYDIMKWLLFNYSLKYTNSKLAVVDWLKDENCAKPNDKVKIVYQGKVIDIEI